MMDPTDITAPPTATDGPLASDSDAARLQADLWGGQCASPSPFSATVGGPPLLDRSPAPSTGPSNTAQPFAGPPQALNDSEPLRHQPWTVDGYPIVDGKYLDLSTGELKTHTLGVDLLTAGPPTVCAYWQNRRCTGRHDQFLVMNGAAAGVRDVTEYLARVGGFLSKGLCKVSSLNATRYDVFVVVSSELSQEEFRDALREHGL